jgi:Pyruvate/2-oxoacid:ferredoxin oxidoreductase delta subunit
MENCTWFGEYAEFMVRAGFMRQVEKKDVLEIKAEAEANSMVSWINNVDSAVGSNVSCSCCGCCCKMLRTVNEFNMPGMIAPPHFMPKIEISKCSFCAKCAKACPMGAITVDTKNKTNLHQRQRCIGCGLCAVACDEKYSISMEPTEKYNKLPSNYTRLLLRLTPNYLRNAFSAWRSRW